MPWYWDPIDSHCTSFLEPPGLVKPLMQTGGVMSRHKELENPSCLHCNA